ncbi:lanthionine synthetase LanC family protein [Saccharothrix luteola]|uniref:lanthionine synthetase LanC family protein n=1 Tax=Saccharothrix luteola TaxID=2893018 RepID=UPI001E5E9016|nr:lanthionine synthetase LanC family protein [Saccharothrix luteola]MCC8250521.1 T3SS effector HopA1 family protein [Saccharothrix luteola]
MTLRREHDDSIAAALDAVTITDKHEVLWFGEPVDQIRPLPDGTVTEALQSSLSRLLYRTWYVYGRPRRDLDLIVGDSDAKPPSQSPRFIRAAIAANRGAETFQASYPVERTERGEFAVVSGVRVAVSQLPDVVRDGERIRVDVSGVSVTKSPGFVLFTSSEGPPSAVGEEPLMRVYWNVTRDGALALVGEITEALAGTAYQFKVLQSDRGWPDRADAAVLYLTKSALIGVWPQLAAVRARIATMLRPYSPALTTPIAPGVGLAQDPGVRLDSFGTYVCTALARHMVQGARVELADLIGIGSHTAQVIANCPKFIVDPAPAPRVHDWLAKAGELADQLVDGALWHGDRCTWLGTDGDSVRSVDASFYQGTAGIGWALAQMQAFTGNPSHRNHAYGSIRQALATASDLPGYGLHTGTSGVGMAVAMAGRWLDDPDLLKTGVDLTHQAAVSYLDTAEAPYDLIDGAAGIVLALIGSDRLVDTNGLDLAVEVATRMVREGRETASGGLCWLDAGREDKAGFVGLGHGASGCVLALGALATATGDVRWADAARRACEYEYEWFDPGASDWRDPRVWLESGGLEYSGRGHGLFRSDWCYGTPGLLLARLAVPGGAENDVRIALHRTRAAAQRFPAHGYATGTCHGAAGLAEVLSLLPPDLREPEDEAIVDHLTRIAVAAADPADPGLMMGIAGAACAALRRHCDTAVSAALPFPRLEDRYECR